jgi:hypothetical protein
MKSLLSRCASFDFYLLILNFTKIFLYLSFKTNRIMTGDVDVEVDDYFDMLPSN